MSYKLGRLPAQQDRARLTLGSVLTKYVYPENKDWLSGVEDWPMYLNDRIGDCTCATAGHVIELMTHYGQGKTVKISDDDVLKAYEAVSGYNPKTGANDNGAVVQDVLDYWRKTGIGNHKIIAFAQVNHRNSDELRTALALFGTVYLGIDFPNTAMDQFDNGEPWDVVRGAYSEGGHAINTGYYDVSDGMWKVVTWGKVQPMTQAFWDKYVDEAWVVISRDWLKANGDNPDGINMYELGRQFTAITGEADPFPEPPEPVDPPVVEPPTPVEPPVVEPPVVTPPAPPVPTPPAPVDEADQLLIKSAKKWLSKRPFFYKSFQRDVQKWLDSK